MLVEDRSVVGEPCDGAAHDVPDETTDEMTDQTIGDVLVGSDRPFLLASGIAGLTPGHPATEDDQSPFNGPDSPRGGSENLAFDFVERAVEQVCTVGRTLKSGTKVTFEVSDAGVS